LMPEKMELTGCPEIWETINQQCITFQKSKYLESTTSWK
jgi:hypothetical protein